jgi:hypothetical protein
MDGGEKTFTLWARLVIFSSKVGLRPLIPPSVGTIQTSKGFYHGFGGWL